MKLFDRQGQIIGGKRYTFEDSKGNKYMVRGDDLDWEGWMMRIRGKMRNNNVEIPENLSDLVEDYICQSQPKGKCYYTPGFGDRTAKVIHKMANIADKSLKALGVNSQLEKKARTCMGCAKRRNSMNQWKVS